MNRSRQTKSRAPQGKCQQKGFTLTEIMIAMTLGLFVAAGLGQLYVAGRSANRIIDSNSMLNENGRFAVEFLAGSVRLAGYYSCRHNQRVGVRSVVNYRNFWFDYEPYDSGEGDREDTGLQGLDGVIGYRVGNSTLPAEITDYVEPKIGTDLLFVRYADIRKTFFLFEDGAGEDDVPTGTLNNDTHTIALSESHDFERGDIAIINTSACDLTSFFHVTDAPDSGNSHAITFLVTSDEVPGNCSTKLAGDGGCDIAAPDLENYHTAELNKLVSQVFFVANDRYGCQESPTDCSLLEGCPTLFTAGTASGFDELGAPKMLPVLRNVTDMKLQFGLNDADPDTPDVATLATTWPAVYLIPEELQDPTADFTEALWRNMVSLRIVLEIVSDDCRKEKFETTVYLRNARNATPGRRATAF